MASQKQLDNALRVSFMEVVKKALIEAGEQVLTTGSNEFAIPCVDGERNDRFLVLTFKIPTGSRDGEAYDGYEMEKEYARKLAEDEAKAKAKAEAKAKKIAKDKANREKLAKSKAEHKTE